MIEIKPDTSLYSDLPSKLRAMALIAEGSQKGEVVEALQHGEWVTAIYPAWDNSHDYRLKPKPREIFVVFRDDGAIVEGFSDENEARRRVESLNKNIPMRNYHYLPFVEIVK